MNPINKKLKEFFPDLNDGMLKQVSLYADEILRFNKAINLISPSTIAKVESTHIADGILGSRIIYPRLNPAEILYDFGSGNGIPGVIFAILYPALKVSAVDRDVRKGEFLKHLKTVLALPNFEVMSIDINDLGESAVAQGTCRAYASITSTILGSRKIFKSKAQFFHFKSDSWSIEVAEMPAQLFSEWKPSLLGEYTLPELARKNCIVLTEKLI